MANSAVNVTTHILHAAQSPWKPQATDTIRPHFDEKGANKISDQYHESLHLKHGQMVALSSRSVKTGKLGCDVGRFRQFFPSLQISVLGVS